MVAEIVQVADALADFLAAGVYSLPYDHIQPEHTYDPTFDPAKVSRLKVSVVAAGWTQDLADRDDGQGEYILDVGIQKHTDLSRRDMDELISLVTEVAKRCLKADLDDPRACATRAVVDPLYSVQHRDEDRIFLSVINVTFLMMYEVP